MTGESYNDTAATQAQVGDALRDIVEGIAPLSFVTLACIGMMVYNEITSKER